MVPHIKLKGQQANNQNPTHSFLSEPFVSSVALTPQVHIYFYFNITYQPQTELARLSYFPPTAF